MRAKDHGAARRLLPLVTVLVAVLGSVLAILVATPSQVLADCGMQAPPSSISGYRGLAFIGTVARTEPVDSAGYGKVPAITYRIERVLAGVPVSSMTVVEGDGGSCWYVDGRRLRVGDRVLVSAAAPVDRGGGHPYLSHKLVWRSTEPGTWRFASGLYGDWVLPHLPKAARSVTTTRAIGALVAPGSGLPDASTSPVPSGPASPGPTVATTRLTTCGGHAYPGLGIDAPLEYGSIDEVEALGQALVRYSGEFPGSRDWPWRLAGRDETGLLFLAETDALGPPGWMSVELEADGDGWRVAGMGQCDPRVVLSVDLGPADWWLDPDHATPGSDALELHVLVLERECASGTSADGRIAEPVVDYGPDAVTITIGVRRAAGDQTCQGNPPTPFAVELSEPLGGRMLLDGGHAPPVVPAPPE